MRSRRRGFLLVMALLLTALLLILGLALMSKRVLQYRGAVEATRAARAGAVAMAGMEEARAKLRNDLFFPVQGAEDQLVFAYAEDFVDVDGQVVGSYVVECDMTWIEPPFSLVRITSTGHIEDPPASRTITAELDVSEVVRGTVTPNPSYFRWINWEDGGSL